MHFKLFGAYAGRDGPRHAGGRAHYQRDRPVRGCFVFVQSRKRSCTVLLFFRSLVPTIVYGLYNTCCQPARPS